MEWTKIIYDMDRKCIFLRLMFSLTFFCINSLCIAKYVHYNLWKRPPHTCKGEIGSNCNLYCCFNFLRRLLLLYNFILKEMWSDLWLEKLFIVSSNIRYVIAIYEMIFLKQEWSSWECLTLNFIRGCQKYLRIRFFIVHPPPPSHWEYCC